MLVQKMSNIVTKDVAEPNDTEKDEDENEDEEEPQLDKDKKHNSGAADLEKVSWRSSSSIHPNTTDTIHIFR